MANRKRINKNWSQRQFENEVYDLFGSAKNQLSAIDQRRALINIIEVAVERLAELGIDWLTAIGAK